MEQKILALLKTKFDGVNDAILSRVAKKLAITATTDELAATAIEGATVQTIVDIYTESRVTESAKTSLTSFREKHGLDENGNKIEVKVEPKNEGQPDIAALISAALKPLMDKVNNLEQEKTTGSRSSVLSEAVKNVPESIKAKVLKDFSRMNFATDEDFTSYVEETKTDLAGIIQADADKGLGGMNKPFVGGTPVPAQQTIAEIKAWSEKNKEKTT